MCFRTVFFLFSLFLSLSLSLSLCVPSDCVERSLFSYLLGVAEERALGAEVGELRILLRVLLFQKVVVHVRRLLLRLTRATDAF